MVTSHLWRELSSRASGVRLQISSLSKWVLKSSNAILRWEGGKVHQSIMAMEPTVCAVNHLTPLKGRGKPRSPSQEEGGREKKKDREGKGIRKERKKAWQWLAPCTPLANRNGKDSTYQNSPSSRAV